MCHPAGTVTYFCNNNQAFAYQGFSGTGELRPVKTKKCEQ